MDELPPYFAIPDDVCQHAGMVATWFPRNRLGVFAFHPTSFKADASKEFALFKPMVHQLRLSVMLFNPVTRKLINESNGTFLAAQKLASKASGSDVRSELLKLSRQYRSIIRACLENLQEEAPKLEIPHKDTTLQLVTIFYNIEFLWHLCEILYVDVIPGDVVLPQFMEWIRFHFFHCERQATTILNNDYGMLEEGAEIQPEYWDTVVGVVLQGRLDAARALLNLHSSSHSEPFKVMDGLLKSMPVYSVYGGLSAAEFNVKWKCWQNECINRLEAGVFASNNNIGLIAKILAGDKQAFREVKSKCETWYQYMAAMLLYTEPTVKYFDLSFHANQCVIQFGGTDCLKSVDLILLALMEFNLQQVIKLIDKTIENGWFAAHLTNLLYHSGCLNVMDNHQVNLTKNLHEELLLNYGSVLMTHPSLWQVGVSYLDHCPVEGRMYLELLLPTLPLATETRALKIMQVAQERGMLNIVSDICKVLGMRSYKQKRLGNALSWALRSQDSGFVTYLADKFLETYNHEGQFHSTDLLEHLGSCMLLSDRLTFLGKYCEFHQLYRASEFRDAASLLVSLMISKLAPKYFWLTLLMDALPLLESNEIVFTSEDTYELLGCLDRLVNRTSQAKLLSYAVKKSDISTQSDSDSESVLTDKINLIRLALGRNLARALNHEACTIDQDNRNEIERDILTY